MKTLPRHRCTISLLSLMLSFAALGASPAWGQLLVNDIRPGTDRTRQPGPSGAQWLMGAGLAASSDASALVIKTGSAPGSFLSYFTAPGYPSTVAIGETLSASLVFSLSNLGTANGVMALRFGLFDSGGIRASDGYPTGGKTFTNYVGYVALMSTRANGAGSTIRERIIGTNYFLNSTETPPFTPPVPHGTGASQAFTAGISYTVTLSATRIDIQTVDFRIVLSGGNFRDYTVTYTDTVAPSLSFDTVGFGWARNLLAEGGVVTVESLRVSLTGGEMPTGE